jgi:HlyD family secretion protein
VHEGPAANGSPLLVSSPEANGKPKTRSLPSETRVRKKWVFYVVALAGVFLVAAAISAYMYFKPAADRPDVLVHKVKRESLDVTVSEKGTLESANNVDVVCKVRAGSKGFASTINWVIEDGARVTKGQLLMMLDDSALQDQSRDQRVKVDQALALKVTAEKQYEITVKTNEQAVAKAENDLLGAEIDLEKFVGLGYDPLHGAMASVIGVASSLTEGGDYKRQVDDVTGQVRLAESDVEQNRERSAWADRMVKMKYMSAAQAQAERSKLDSSLEKLRSVQNQKNLLFNYDRKKLLANMRSAVDNAQRALDKSILEADATRAQADIKRKTETNIYNNEAEKLRDLEDQIKECKIHAPQDGMVVYFKNESNRFGGSQQPMIEQGAQVKEGQKLLRIPNLDRMQVNTKIHEVMVSRIYGDVQAPTYFVDQLRVGMLAVADPFTRLMGQKEEVLQHLRDEHRRDEYRTTSRGQEATIKVDAKQELVLKGRVRSVARVASQADAFMSDVKLYPTIVLIEGRHEGLNPDMSAEVTIHIRGIKDVLTVPLQSVVGGSELGTKRKVYVKTEAGTYETKDVSLGIYNDKVIEVREGLEEGDEVVINPKVLLGDTKQKTRDGAAPGGDGKSAPGGGKAPDSALPGDEKKKKFKGGGGPQPPQG